MKFSQDPEQRRRVLQQFKGNEDLREFLLWVLARHYNDNVFTDGYGEERAFHDGVAKEAQAIFELIRSLDNGGSAELADQ